MKFEPSTEIVLPDRFDELTITGQNCRLEIVSLEQDIYGVKHLLLRSHPLETDLQDAAIKKDSDD